MRIIELMTGFVETKSQKITKGLFKTNETKVVFNEVKVRLITDVD